MGATKALGGGPCSYNLKSARGGPVVYCHNNDVCYIKKRCGLHTALGALICLLDESSRRQHRKPHRKCYCVGGPGCSHHQAIGWQLPLYIQSPLCRLCCNVVAQVAPAAFTTPTPPPLSLCHAYSATEPCPCERKPLHHPHAHLPSVYTSKVYRGASRRDLWPGQHNQGRLKAWCQKYRPPNTKTTTRKAELSA